VKRLRCEPDTESVEERVKYPDLIRARRQFIDPELPEGIGLKGCACALDENLGPREVSAVQAVENYAENFRLAAPGTVGRVRRRAILRADGGRKNDEHGDEDSTLPEHCDRLCWVVSPHILRDRTRRRNSHYFSLDSSAIPPRLNLLA
jgi:hypothetical protein